MKFPTTIDWFVTSKCNLKCNYCYGPIPEKEDQDVIKKITSKLLNSKTKNITLCGGEPFLSPQIFEIISELKENGKNIFLSTNGHFPDKIRKVLAEVSGVSISLDGFNAEENAKMRGVNANFNKAIESIKLVKCLAPKKLKITTVLSKINYKQLPEFGQLIDEIQPNVWRIIQFVPRMKGFDYKDDFDISDEVFSETIANLKDRYPKIKIFASSNSEISSCFLIDHWGNIILPSENCYKTVGNCFKDHIDNCWEKFWEKKNIHEDNKLWMKEMN